ncbi:MAG: hypothetical protein ACOWWO_12060 [Peptococcaceae bacterium]
MSERKQESLFTAEELRQGARSLGVKPEVMAGAVKLAGKSKMTKAEVKAAIIKFTKREV